MKYYSLKVEFKLKENIHFKDISSKIGISIQKGMYNQEKLRELHCKKNSKYIFSTLYPFIKKEIYEKNEKYFVSIQSFDEETIVKFNYALSNFENNYIKVLSTNLKERDFDNKIITEIETLTPVVATIDDSFWKKDIHSLDILIQRIYDNLEKKYLTYFKDDINVKSDFNKYSLLEKITILSEKPIGRKYKNITIVGYKIKINVGTNEIAQKLAKTAIVMGVGEKNSIIGSGYAKYKSVRE